MLLRRGATLAASGRSFWLARASSSPSPPRAPSLLPCGPLAAAARARTAPRSLSSSSAAAAASSPQNQPEQQQQQQQHQQRKRKHRVVFLGTPEPAACVLRSLLEASRHPSSDFEVAAVVSQPPKAQGRGRRAAPPSPVAAAAAQAGFFEEEEKTDSSSSDPPLSPEAAAAAPPLLLCPSSPKDEAFLERMERLAPDLCVTVAYGGLLNSRFLSLPRRGTLNIHPSLLPRWRGAAPVQRTLAAGDAECGVSLAFTVLALDAGPILASERLPTPAAATAPELLSSLMAKGGELLLRELPGVLSGESSFESATPQDEVERLERERRRRSKEAPLRGEEKEEEEGKEEWSFASHAARLTRDDGRIDPFSQSLEEAFNRWRSAAGWPGGWLVVRVEGEEEEKELRLEEAAPLLLAEQDEVEAAKRAFSSSSSSSSFPPPAGALAATKSALLVSCADGGVLKVTRVKPAGRKGMGAGAWANGLGGKKVEAVRAAAAEVEVEKKK